MLECLSEVEDNIRPGWERAGSRSVHRSGRIAREGGGVSAEESG